MTISKVHLLILVLVIALCSCSVVLTPKDEGEVSRLDPSNKQNFHVYLLIGQSNMAGRAAMTAEQYNALSGTLLFDNKMQWQQATNPLNRFSSIRKSLSMQKLGPGYSFAQTMMANIATNDMAKKIGLVVNAKGGSSIKEWSATSSFYQEALKRAKQAQKSGILKGVLWHQGETDFADKDYLNKLIALVNNLRKDLSHPNLPFVVGQINNVPLINNQISQLPNYLKQTAVVSAEGLTATDKWHFDNKSVIEMGKRYAQKVIELKNSTAQ